MPRRTAALILLATLASSPLTLPVATADDWPQWLGPNRDGVWRETGIAASLPAGGPKVVWTAPVAAGYSGPAVAGDRVFVTDRLLAPNAKLPGDPFSREVVPGSERVLCLDDATGRLAWTYEYDCPYSISYGLGPRATPTVDTSAAGEADRVYTLGAMGHLACLDVRTGKAVWKKELREAYQVAAPLWGFSAHPLIDGDHLITLAGGDGSLVVALDKHTGAERWRALSAKEIGYCPPVIREFGGKRELLIFNPEAVAGLDPQTGDVLWSVPITPSYAMSIAMPRKSGDELFVTAYQDVSALLTFDGATPAAEPRWRGTKKVGIDCPMMTPWFEQGHIYGCDSGGSLACVRASDGKRLWETSEPVVGRRPVKQGNAFIIKNQPNGTFYLFNEQGDLLAADLTPEGYKERGHAHLIDPTSTANNRPVLWMHPAFAHQSVYARNDHTLVKASLAADNPK